MDQIVSNIEGVSLTPLKVIEGELGTVMHALKQNDPYYFGFGEAYFSTIHPGKIKGWKKHSKMTLNLVVPFGEIKFVIYDDRTNFPSQNQFFEVTLSLQNYHRLTISPMLWMAFQGFSTNINMLLNLASIPHDPQETIGCALNEIPYEW